MEIKQPTPNDLARLKLLFSEAFGDDGTFNDTFFECAYSPSRAMTVKEDGALVGMLYWFDCEYSGGKLAYIYAVATAKEYRGRGVGKALMEFTHAHLSALGYIGAILKPAEDSLFDFYGKLGYKNATRISEISPESATQGCQFSKISANEYARLRRDFLPSGGVIQEGESIALLSKISEFIRGDDFILAYSRDGENLFGYELLGNDEKAAEILHSLGAKSGKFRIVGNQIPFTMWYQFDKNAPVPEHFGFVFD